MEYWCFDEDELWSNNNESLISLAKDEFKKTGLLKDGIITQGYVYKIPRCYPVYDYGYKTRLSPIEEYLSNIKKLSVIGRYGSFKYNNQDHSILMGILAAKNINNHENHNLWQVNSDYEDYQENSRISESGLLITDKNSNI
jgi:protoporphyrinogen oxidase